MTMLPRRQVLASLAAAGAALPLRSWAQVAGSRPKGASITLLGTGGGPPPRIARSQPANLLVVDGKSYLIDAGENVAQQLLRAGVPPPQLGAAFLTHLHWDHTLGLDYLMASGWMMGRNQPMPIWGPPGTRLFVGNTLKSVGVGEAIFRGGMPGHPRLASLYPVREINLTAPQLLLDDGTVKVSAVANSHFARIPGKPHAYGQDKAYSYRFDTAYGAVVFSGDTGPSDALAQFASGADVLVAEIVDLASMRIALQGSGNSGGDLDLLMQHMEHEHLTAEALGRMAQQARVKKLVLSHFVVGRDFDPANLIAPLRRHYTEGEIIIGRDLANIAL
jgi:ribonuclease BN (tRNA processing enzyme)